MDNFQLYRTNVMLGGQMKWDLILDSFESDLIVNDFHISPICDSVPYNKYSQESLLNYSHQENIKKYYKKISGSFYENYTDPKLESAWPIITDIPLDTHVGNFEMGCRRSLYKIYNKQFEFFCPIWLEQLNDDLIFELSAYSSQNNKILQKRLELRKQDIKVKEHEYHNKFVNYFNEYIKYIGLDKGNNNVMSIHLDKGVAQLYGLNVQTGLNNTLDISYIVDNLISRERPLLEFDNIIINQIKDHKLITPQLFNFNLCFNPEDILPPAFINMLSGKSISFKLFVYIGNKKLEIKDFYSNYEYIPRKYVGTTHTQLSDNITPNVLDYLQDYKCIDLIDKNKMVQNTIHWSLADNNDYIFNVYEGFKGFSILNGEIINHAHLYDDSPNIQYKQYKQYLNSIGWCNYLILENNVETGKISEIDFWNNIEIYINNGSNFSNDANWVNKIKYKKLKDEQKLKVLFILNNLEDFLNFERFDANSGNNTIIYEKKIKIVNDGVIKYNNSRDSFETPNILQIMSIKDSNVLIFSCNYQDKDLLTFINMRDILQKIYNNKSNLWGYSNAEIRSRDHICNLIDFFIKKINTVDSLNSPKIIIPKTSLSILKENGPSLSTQEISYYKNDAPGEYVLRYFGKIKPTFVNSENDINFNYVYYKDYLSDNRLDDKKSEYQRSKYNIYSNTNYNPIFPSIDFFSIKKIKIDYEHIPMTYKNDSMLNKFENHWYNKNKNIVLSNTINAILYSEFDENGDYIKLEKLIKNFLKKYYKNDDNELIEYIYKLYNVESSFDYTSLDDIKNYTYVVKLTLK